MAKEKQETETLRRGEPENRSNFDRAKDDYEGTDASTTRVVERTDSTDGGCPTCHSPMLLRHSYRSPDRYHFEGICSADAEHNIERYGYYSTEGSD